MDNVPIPIMDDVLIPIMDNVPNDIHREIMKLLDCYSICNLYMANKIFWVLSKEQIKYYRIMCKVSPHSRGHNELMVMDKDQMLWIPDKLTEKSRLELLEKYNIKFINWGKNPVYEYNNIRTGIYHLSRRGCTGYCVYLKIWIKYERQEFTHIYKHISLLDASRIGSV